MNALKTADFTRIDAGAVGEDIKVGIEHSMRWDRTAVVTEVKWLRHTIKFFSFLMPGKMPPIKPITFGILDLYQSP